MSCAIKVLAAFAGAAAAVVGYLTAFVILLGAGVRSFLRDIAGDILDRLLEKPMERFARKTVKGVLRT